MASSSRSPVRTRYTADMGDTKILPPPMLPVYAASMMMLQTLSVSSFLITSSTLVLGNMSISMACVPRKRRVDYHYIRHVVNRLSRVGVDTD